MSQVEDYIFEFQDKQGELLKYFHELLCNRLGLEAKMRYQIPFYYRNSWICYLNPGKKGRVEFAFTRGNELSNSQGLLDSKGRKQVLSIEYQSLEDVNEEILIEILHEAILLDESVPYASKRKKK